MSAYVPKSIRASALNQAKAIVFARRGLPASGIPQVKSNSEAARELPAAGAEDLGVEEPGKRIVKASRYTFDVEGNAPRKQGIRPGKSELGERIYVYHHLQKNHVVYSLTKSLRNNAALSQIPFNGKKTVPAALRKDLWSPFAVINFPPKSSSICLQAFQKLREYRRRHELEWGNEIAYKDQTPTEIEEGLRREREDFRVRGRKIQDQRANSVADIAAVLERLGEAGKEMEEHKPIGLKVAEPLDVTVLWRDVHDAEFAPTWSSNVEHGELEQVERIESEEQWETDAGSSEAEMSEAKPSVPQQKLHGTEQLPQPPKSNKVSRELKREIYEEAARIHLQQDEQKLNELEAKYGPEAKAKYLEKLELQRIAKPIREVSTSQKAPMKRLTAAEKRQRAEEEKRLAWEAKKPERDAKRQAWLDAGGVDRRASEKKTNWKLFG